MIIDESSMISEYECAMTFINAKQVVLIGDCEQLGPNYSVKVTGYDSLFKRLFNNMPDSEKI